MSQQAVSVRVRLLTLHGRGLSMRETPSRMLLALLVCLFASACPGPAGSPATTTPAPSVDDASVAAVPPELRTTPDASVPQVEPPATYPWYCFRWEYNDRTERYAEAIFAGPEDFSPCSRSLKECRKQRAVLGDRARECWFVQRAYCISFNDPRSGERRKVCTYTVEECSGILLRTVDLMLYPSRCTTED